MHAEALAWPYDVVIQHAQHAEVNPRWVVPVGKAEAVMRIEPAVVGVAAFGGGVEDGFHTNFYLRLLIALKAFHSFITAN
jgi:hypothetical protein